MQDTPEFSRWRLVAKPVSPMDPIDCASLYKEGHLPPGFVLLLWDGTELRGPIQFKDQAEADDYLYANTEIASFLVIPRPLSDYK